MHSAELKILKDDARNLAFDLSRILQKIILKQQKFAEILLRILVMCAYSSIHLLNYKFLKGKISMSTLQKVHRDMELRDQQIA